MILNCKNLIAGLVIIGLSISGLLGSENVEFDSNHHNFGWVYQLDDMPSISYSFKNKGTQPIGIKKVVSFDSTLAINWLKEWVPVGGSSEIRISVFPKNKVGKVQDSVWVYFTGDEVPTALSYQANFVNGARDQKMNHQVGALEMRSKYVSFGYVYQGSSIKKVLPVTNTSNEAIQLEWDNSYAHISVHQDNNTIEAGEQALVEFVLDTRQIEDWDLVTSRIGLTVISGKKKYEDEIAITTNLREDFTKISTHDSLYAPQANFEMPTYRFGEVEQGEPVKYAFNLTNTGKQELHIRKIMSNCGVSIGMPDKRILQPGETTEILVSMETQGRSGKTRQGISVITNDPFRYKQILWFEGIIKHKAENN